MDNYGFFLRSGKVKPHVNYNDDFIFQLNQFPVQQGFVLLKIFKLSTTRAVISRKNSFFACFGAGAQEWAAERFDIIKIHPLYSKNAPLPELLSKICSITNKTDIQMATREKRQSPVQRLKTQ